MRSSVRPRPADAPPGLVGTARVERRVRDLLPRLRPGDIAVLDHLDMDRATAQALADRGCAAVVDAAAIISGRFPNLGPQSLVDAGVVVVDSAGADVLTVKDGARVRLHEGTLYVDDVALASGRPLDADEVSRLMEQARAGLADHLAALTHTSTEMLRREQDLLLHGRGVPRLATKVAGRPVVVVGRDPAAVEQLRAIRTFVREQHPVVVVVAEAAAAARVAGLRPDVLVVDADGDLPPAALVKAARDVVVRADRGRAPALVEALERVGAHPVVLETSATPEDAALVVADAAGPAVVVPVGMDTTLEDLLDSRRPGVAGTYLVRLKLGPRLVDVAAVPHLYAGRVRPWHLLVLMLAGFVALAAAVSVTPVGQEWVDAASAVLSDLYDRIQGLFS